jgi:8-oxo-dGTP diphosphatase
MPSQSSHEPLATPTSEFVYCPYCAVRLKPHQNEEGEQRPTCPECGWTHYHNPTVGVAAIILTAEGLLLGRRRNGGWCIPCGHVEWNESIREAVVREMREELGVGIELGPVYNAHSNFHDPQHHTVGIWFQAALPTGSVLVPGGDLIEIRPFHLDQIPDLVFPTDRLIVQQLRHERMDL